MAAQDYISVVQQLYVSYFGRPADYYGLQNFTAQLAAIDTAGELTTFEALSAAANAAAPTSALGQLINSFSSSAEAAALYGTDMSQIGTSKFVAAIYQNILGREADVEGLTFWVNAILNGTLTRANAAAAITEGAMSNTTAQGLIDAQTVAKKNAVAVNFTAAIDTTAEINGFAGDAAAAAARGMLSTVTSATDPTAFQATVESTLATIVTGSTPITNFTLTTSQDNLTGTAGNDVFTAGVAIAADGTTLVDTLQSIDQINAGAGNDTLNVTLNGAGTVGPSMTGVENVVIRSTAATGTLNLAASTGVTSVKFANSTDAAAVTNVGAAAVAIENQSTAVAIGGSTASAVTLSLKNVDDGAGAELTVAVEAAVADTATSLVLSVEDSMVDLNSANNDAYTAVSVAATGDNVVTLTDVAGVATSLTVTGSGSVDFSGVALTKVKTVTAGDGGVEVDATGNSATTLAVTSGGGDDTFTVTGANLTTASTGAGDDSVTVTTAMAATSTVTLGEGDDIVTLGAAPTAGATLTGGDGSDTIAMTKAAYATVAAFSSTNLGKITGFEVLGLTDILTAAGGPYDVSKIAGITGVNVLGGVTNAETSAVTGLGANALVTLGGAATATGVLSLALKTDTAADVVTIKAYNDYTDNNDTTADAVAMAQTFTATGIETINLVSSGKMNSFTPVTDYAADVVTNTITINDDALVTLNINGDKKASVTTAATMEDLTTINASANTAGVTIISSASTVDLAITGSATAANNLTGGAGADTITGGSKADVLVGGAGKDTIVGGAGNDTITGGAKADTLTGGTGNDIFVIAAGTDSSLVDLDVIADFSGNTYGQGTNGAATTAGALNADSAKWTGDIINLVAVAGGLTKIDSSVQSNAADALTFLQNIGDTTADTIGAALDSSTGRLYIDVGSDGTADMVIQLTGVTTITEAAFRIA